MHNAFDKKIGTIGRSACINECQTNGTIDDEVGQMADRLAMHCLGFKPSYIQRKNIPETVLNGWKQEIEQTMGPAMKDKPEAVVKKIMEGKLAGYYEDNVLYDMEYLLGEGEDMNIRNYVDKMMKDKSMTFDMNSYVLWEKA